MALKLLRGTTAQCQAYTPDIGEPIYDTDLKKLYIGDGATPGGIAVEVSNNSLGLDDLTDVTVTQPVNANASLIWDTNTSNFIVGDPTKLSDKSIGELSNVDITTQAPNVGQVLKWNGTKFIPADDNSVAGTGLVTGATYEIDILGDATGSVFSTDGNTTLVDGTNNILTNGDLKFENNVISASISGEVSVDSKYLITRSYGVDGTTDNATTLGVEGYRGTSAAPLAVEVGDTVGAMIFTAYDGTLGKPKVALFAGIDTVTGTNALPGVLTIRTHDADGLYSSSATFNSRGVFNAPVIQPGVYADATARDAAILTPAAGMMVFVTDVAKFQGYDGTAWTNLN